MTQLTTITWLKLFLKRANVTFTPFSANNTTTFLRLTALVFCLFAQILVIAQPLNKKAGKKQGRNITKSGSQKDSLQKKDVQLLYSSVAPDLTTTSTATVYSKDIIKSPVSSPYSAIVGRLAGINFYQGSGQPLQDAASFTLHGRTPIVLIDGVARNLNSIDLDEIESVTILKDAVSTAMLGVRGANGALSIVTKRGSVAKQSISFTAQSGIQEGLGMVKPLGAYDYAVLKNEAIVNELRTNPNFNGVKYSAADLQAYQNGTDSLGHPNVDWQNQLFNKTAMISRYNFNISGGNKNSRYFASLENLNQNGFLKTSPLNKYSTNNFIKSYLARTNIELNITSKLVGGISLFGRIINTNEPGGIVSDNSAGNGINDIYNSILTTPNNAYPVYNANGSYYGNPNFLTNLQAQSTGTGYNQGYIRDVLADIYLKRSLDEILKGLWIKGKVSYSSNLTEKITRTKNLVVFNPNGTGGYTQLGNVVLQRNTNAIQSQGRSNYVEVSAGYAHTFKEKHNVDALVMYNSDQSIANSDLPYTVTGGSAKLSYNYNKTYVVEAAFAYNGSNRYPTANNYKYGFFPSVGAAWNISNEKFMQHIKWMDALKLFGSYGSSGWDNPGYFAYLQRYNNNANVYFGNANASNGTLVQSTLANPNITWEKANKLTVGLQGSLIKNRLSFSVEYYNNKFTDLLQQRGHSTSIIGTSYPNENIGSNLYKGFDFQLNWQETKKDFTYFVAANATLQTSKVLYSDEVTQPYAWMNHTDNKVGRPFGYVANGLFQSQADITGAATFLGYTPQPGDIRYKDLNGDGVINQLDQTAIGTNKPFIYYGVNMGFSIKGFDLSALFQGAANTDAYLLSNTNAFLPFQNGGLGQAYQNDLDRWSASTPNSSYPRVGIGSNTNNQAFSSFWYRSGDYVRLKNLEIGYTLPSKLLVKTKILTSARVFANGLNLVTWSGLPGNRDPEVFGTYPIQRVFNFGVNIKL